MFGASMSELYLLIKSLINIERTVDQCVITHTPKIHAYTGTVSQAWLYKHAAHTGPAYDRLVQYMLQVVEVALTDDSTLAIFFYMRYW